MALIALSEGVIAIAEVVFTNELEDKLIKRKENFIISKKL